MNCAFLNMLIICVKLSCLAPGISRRLLGDDILEHSMQFYQNGRQEPRKYGVGSVRSVNSGEDNRPSRALIRTPVGNHAMASRFWLS
jgi:hypothetical protein